MEINVIKSGSLLMISVITFKILIPMNYIDVL